MQQDRLVSGLTVVFAAMTAMVMLVGIVAVEPALFLVAIPLAAATGLFWYQSSGRLRERVLRMQADRAAGGGGPTGGPGGRASRDGRAGGFGAGARRAGRRERRRQQRGDAGRDDRSRAARWTASGLSRTEAYRRLDLEPDADEAAVRDAYRRKVKEVHPDRGGDEQAFKRVTEAYETLVE